MRFKKGDFVTLHGKKAQVHSVFHDEGLDGAVICYFPQVGVRGPGWPRVRQDQLEPWEGPKSLREHSPQDCSQQEGK